MYRDASTLPPGTVLTGFDICIVGAGVAGLTIASRLAGSGRRVLVLCDGLPGDDGSNPDPARQSIMQGTTGPFMTKVRPPFLQTSRLNMYGGTSNHFTFNAHPLSAEDLAARPGFRQAEWPIGIDELNRYSAQANCFGGYGPYNYGDIAFWAKALHGHPWDPQPADRFINHIFRSQSNTSIVHFQLQLGEALEAAADITVLFNAHVLEIDSAGSRRVTGLNCSTIQNGRPGIAFQVGPCEAFVLAQGGIEPVRLLKVSGNLGDNAQGMLGSGFMLHPVIWDAATVDLPGPWDPQIHNFYRPQTVVLDPDPVPRLSRRIFPDTVEWTGKIQFQAWGLLSPDPALMAEKAIGSFQVWQATNDDNTQLKIGLTWESAPNPDSTIALDETAVDPVFGQPVVRVDWNLLESDKRTVRTALAELEMFYSARGATNFQIDTDLDGGPDQWTFSPGFQDGRGIRPGDHHMGALRMSAAPADGIVDANCRVHTVDNLFIAGSGVFPASGSANPTLTIVALALRLADHLEGVQSG